ncbi:MAG TPA: hypothetical protein VN631_02190 [Negativicutes bacterium]|nr:hypothetical protein [Negativicutes bacterium]
MDIGLFVIIMIVMYVIPEIMKRLKPKKPYQYPEFPSTLPPDGNVPVGMPGELSRGVKPPPVPVMTGEGMPGDEGDPSWGLHVEPVLPEMKGLTEAPEEKLHWGAGGAAMGLVWAEIIAPPVALRPMRHGIRRL